MALSPSPLTLNEIFYTPVIKHSNGKSPFSIGNTSSKGSFSIAMLDYQRVGPRLQLKYILGICSPTNLGN